MDNQAFELLLKKLDEHGNELREVKSDIGKVKDDLGHYKGFLGGITFVFALVWSAGTYFFTNIINKNHT
jgi:hypothetical protein